MHLVEEDLILNEIDFFYVFYQQNLRRNDVEETNTVDHRSRDLVLKERNPKANAKDGIKKPTWATNGSDEQDEEEAQVFIRYYPKAKEVLKKDMYDLDSEYEDTSPGQSKKFDIKYEFNDLNTYVVTASKGKLKHLMDRSKKNIALVEDDPVREFAQDHHVMEENVNYAEESFNYSHRNLQTSFTDQLTNGQWRPYGVSMVQAPQVWPYSTGEGVKVCVIDSGIYRDSPDFVKTNLSGNDTSTSIRWYQDACGHGTHVSGTIAGKNNNIGVVGVAYNAKIHTIRIFSSGTNGCGRFYASGGIAATNLCKAAGAKVINMSYQGENAAATEASQFQSLYENYGMLSVAAAGNGEITEAAFPASYPYVVSVASVDRYSNRAIDSKYNDMVDIAAPGVLVKSVKSGDSTGYNVETKNGTSMAAPHVSAVAALLFAKFRTSNPKQDVENIRNAMLFTAQDRGIAGRDHEYGYGIVKAWDAYQCLKIGDCPSCVDDPQGWYDSEGPEYSCSWYAQDYNCAEYGNDYENFGKTAKQACCACNGGAISTCSDSPQGWYDSDGPTFSCAWYSEGSNCEEFGDSFANFGKTANQACCVCDGGS